MAVILYKPGNSKKVRGVPVDVLVCDEYSYLHNLDQGWFYSPEECYENEQSEETNEEKAKKETAEKAESERQSLLEKARGYGFSPHPKTGIPKLEVMIIDYEELRDITAKAVELGIDVTGDIGFDEIKALIDEKGKEEDAE